MPDLQNLLDQIDRLDQEATKGPWIIDSIESGEHALFIDEDNPGYGHLGASSSTVASFLLAENANYIANARESLPQLAKALRAVMDLEDESLDGDLQGYEIDQYIGYNQALRSAREAITDAIGDDDA